MHSWGEVIQKTHLEEKLSKFPVMFAIQVWLLCSYPSEMGNLSFSAWQPEMANEPFFLANFSWGVANYSCGYVLFWWWPWEIVRKQGKKKELGVRTVVVVHWKTGCVLHGSCRCCSRGARGAGGGRAGGDTIVSSARSAALGAFLAFPAGPAPQKCRSAGSVRESLAESAQRKLRDSSPALFGNRISPRRPEHEGCAQMCTNRTAPAGCGASHRGAAHTAQDSARLRAGPAPASGECTPGKPAQSQLLKAPWWLEPSSPL